jgi:tRNA 2-selenouridine synthase
MAILTDIDNAAARIGHLPFIDVRSSSEFRQGHIPGAFNICLLDNEERAEVGTTYKQQGREAAVLRGFELAGGKFAEKIKQVRDTVEGRELVVYCWRGGMRSSIMAWLLNLAGFRVHVIKGGYKSFRQWALSTVEQPRKVIILGGYTGSGKTEVLKALEAMGEKIIDLERMAHHKGSAFGGLGENAQPTTEHFENRLAVAWSRTAGDERLWIENESRMIGVVKIPDAVYSLMRNAPVLEIDVSREERIGRILSDYGKFTKEELRTCTEKIKKRLGDLRLRQALEELDRGNLEAWAGMMLQYYDNFYSYGNGQREPEKVFHIAVNGENAVERALKVLKKAKEVF